MDKLSAKDFQLNFFVTFYNVLIRRKNLQKELQPVTMDGIIDKLKMLSFHNGKKGAADLETRDKFRAFWRTLRQLLRP
jgi:hypothetical protein